MALREETLANSPSTSSPTSTPTPTPTPVSTPVPGRPLVSSCFAPTSTASTSFSFEQAYAELAAIDGLIGMEQPNNDSSIWFAIERRGRVVSFPSEASAATVTEVLDIRGKVSTSVEMGLTGIAVHPNYPTDNRIFILYNDGSNGGRSTLSELTVNTNTLTATGETVLLTLDQPADNHNGGDMHFGADGFLYAAFGDGGLDQNESQDLTNLLGTLVRIDITTPGTYSIPGDNPFNLGQSRCTTGNAAQNCPETFAYGFRNPWRWSVDSSTGDLWVADVGENTWEEVNRVVSGGNYGWPEMEGEVCFADPSCNPANFELPISVYDRSTGVSITGGFVYRGSEVVGLQGQYVFGDAFFTNVLSVSSNAAPGTTASILFDRSSFTLAAFAQDNEGEIYALDLGANTPGDSIYKLTGFGATASMPALLSNTGCLETDTKSLTEGVVGYSINSTLWSDGADKTRFFAIPNNETIGVLGDGDFSFPVGSILIKNFVTGTTYIETRFLVHHDIGWRGYSYEWRDDQSDAELVDSARTKNVGPFIHTFPSSAQCFACHTNGANVSLGPEQAQFNRVSAGQTSNQLQLLSDMGYFSEPIDSTSASQMFAIDDSSASLAQRARSYLHSNCSGCHRPAGTAAFMDLRFSTLISDTNTCDQDATNGDLGLTDPKRIDPGNASNSVIVSRMQATDGTRMPPLASLIVDSEAVDVISQWINTMDASCQ